MGEHGKNIKKAKKTNSMHMMLIPRLHDTTGCQTGLTTVLNEQLFVQLVVKLGCTTGLTTVLNEPPLFVQPVVEPGCTTGCIHDTADCQTGCQTGLTTG